MIAAQEVGYRHSEGVYRPFSSSIDDTAACTSGGQRSIDNHSIDNRTTLSALIDDFSHHLDCCHVHSDSLDPTVESAVYRDFCDSPAGSDARDNSHSSTIHPIYPDTNDVLSVLSTQLAGT